MRCKVPLELREAQNYINTYHRHHQAAHRDKFRIAAMKDEKNEKKQRWSKQLN